jgi:hypothetical protein
MALALLAASAVIGAHAAPPVYQRGYDANVSGANLAETALTTSNVGAGTFGRLFNLPVDSNVFAQPLYVPNVAIPGQGTHNVLYVATMNDTVYAFDADAGGAPLWSTNLASLFDTTAVVWANFNISPVVSPGKLGILSTPVIDQATNIMYVVACTLESDTMVYRLHAIDITTGTEPYGPGVLISGSYGGVTFDAPYLTQRTSLVLAGGQVIMAFGAMEAEYTSNYSGWVVAYNKTTLQRSGIFATITTSSGGGVWQSGRPPVVDGAGNVYLFVGNAFGNGYDGVHNFSESALKFDTSDGLALVDWFTCGNWSALDTADQDLTSSGPLLIPGTALLAGGGKNGYLYVLNTADLGKYVANDSQVVQKENISAGEIHGGPVFWNRSTASGGPLMYDWGLSDILKAYPFSGSTFAAGPSATGPAGNAIFPGGILTLSANGSQAGTGLLWATTSSLNPSIGVLHAYDAANVAHELWNSMMVPSRDSYGFFAKFVPPLVVNGKVYVATFSDRVSVFGLGVAAPAFTASPTSIAFGNVQTTTTAESQAVTVTNGGSAALPITSITFTGTNAGAFSQTNNCGASVPAGSTCTISVAFAPAAVGSQTAWLNVNGGKSLGTVATALSGTGVAPFTVSPTTLAFGTEQTTTASAAQKVTVTNGGSAALPITGITLTGPNSAEFSQTNTCGASVPVGSPCTISVVFKPTTSGYGWAMLNVGGGPGTTHSVTVNGTGIVPYKISPAALAFGDVQLNTASAAQSVTVTNNGSTPLSIASISLSGANAGSYSQTNSCGSAVPVGSTCKINVVFKPIAAGSQTATLTVGAPGAAYNTVLSGTGAVPFTVGPALLKFGSVATNTSSAPQSVTVTNNGSVAITISAISLAGANASEFSQTNTCSAPVPAGSTCTISIVFSPTATGYGWATLKVSGPGATNTAAVNGTGT